MEAFLYDEPISVGSFVPISAPMENEFYLTPTLSRLPMPTNTVNRRRLASRISKLGTETAFSVSSEAAELAAQGKKIYPFHIGDLNIPTPAHIVTAAKKAIDEGKTGYCAAAGLTPLREIIAKEIGASRGVTFTKDQVSVQPGGKAVIGKFLSSVMEEGDEVLYPSPGYPIYESQINYLGGKAVPYTFKETPFGYVLDMDYLRSLITTKTKVFIFNNYHNPTGASSSKEEMAEIARICVAHDLWVLADEAYFDLVFDEKPRSIVSFPGMLERTTILFTFSKTFCMTGWRLAASISPIAIAESISRLNTNQEACTAHFVQIAGIAAFSEEGKHVLEKTKTELKRRRDLIVTRLNAMKVLHTYSPPSTFYAYVNVTKAMKLLGETSVESFRRRILESTGVSFCTREHFGSPLRGEKNYYVRFAFSGISCDMINEAMDKLEAFFEESTGMKKMVNQFVDVNISKAMEVDVNVQPTVGSAAV
eukprot:TRINITY_DN6896_c0_g4_i1.p1 TRINITY_DN6896_c0_g4~~TRINITY_DN6896_c0_g4_i1.p1  ORF type:complete len:478 (+),score=101.23 TRINITY_DN6896_c0_g4_i1:190-1623(+)